LIFEDLFGIGIQFPHLYGRLNKDAVTLVETLPAIQHTARTLNLKS
jgi:uncharacterized protein (DUF952 family)